MKTVPPPCPEPESGPKYWRSLDQLADTHEFRQWLEKEFPHGASELADGPSRRQFVKIMSASFMLAGLGLTGCRRPEETILPFGKAPTGYVHGVPQFYATAMPTRGSAIPLVVRSQDGRPVKVEGNPQHPASNGGTDQFAQASILGLYDPDRATKCKRDGQVLPREEARVALSALGNELAAAKGAGTAFLLERSSSPSRERVISEIRKTCPEARFFVHEPVDFDIHREAASLAFGKSVAPAFHFDKAKVIVSLDCDFLGSEEDTYINVRRYAKGRKVSGPNSSISRLYAMEALFTLTGANADHRLRLPSSSVLSAAAKLASLVLAHGHANEVAPPLVTLAGGKTVDAKWITECAADLMDEHHHGEVLVVAGHRQPLAVHLMAHAINVALGAIGKTVTLHAAPAQDFGSLAELVAALNAGSVETLIQIGGNPAYTAPVDVDWAKGAAKAKRVIRVGYSEDESYNAKGWHIPLSHYLESWGDARTADGTLVPVQPLIAPLFDSLNELEILGLLAGLKSSNPHDIVRDTFAGIAGKDENAWRKFLHDGFLAKSASTPEKADFRAAAVAKTISEAKPLPAPAENAMEVVFHRSYSMDDGRFANNGWLQETPDPVTKLTWDNAILVSPATAQSLGVMMGKDLFTESKTNKASAGLFAEKVAEVKLNGRSIKGAVWIQPGMPDNVIGLALGYGRDKAGRVGSGNGYNAYKLRSSTGLHFAVGASLTANGETMPVACTQEHGAMEGRPIVREANLTQYAAKPDFAKNLDLESPEHSSHIDKDKARGGLPKTIYKNPVYTGMHQWGMSIDLTSCVGCTACLVACQSENNIPIVGKDQVRKGREMHWLRLDRYYAGDVANPQLAFQPMLCQHCENAPCESVCPVNATVHDEEGLNLMAYNRCVGTRYCSNNCPYKVRRFNYFDYNRRPLDELYTPPFGKNPDGSWELARWFKDPSAGSIEKGEWDLMKLAKNPNVSVRMRGVMEKCSFCVQRIEEAKINQKIKAKDSDKVRVPDGTFKTACQQACPADAIVFGDTSDPESRVSQLKKSERDYSVLGFLDTRPRLTYLARIRNPNPRMPDYHENPLSLQEHMDKHHADPFGAGHGGSHAAETSHAPAAAGKGGH